MSVTAHASNTRQVEFCGRDGELEAITAALGQLGDGTSAVVVVEGGAGMGKSRLLAEVIDVARGLGLRVGASAADPSESVVELAALLAALSDASSYAGIGASWDAGRVRSRLRTLGVRRRMATAEPETHGWAALTGAEVAVARLVAEGLTNRDVAERLFLSPHTVNSHLRHVFTKLRINSRVELVRFVSTADVD